MHADQSWANGAPEGFQGTRIILYLFSDIVFAFPTSNCDSYEAIHQITSSRPIFGDLIQLLVHLGFFGTFTRPNGDILSRIFTPLHSHTLASVVWKYMESLEKLRALPRTLSTRLLMMSPMRRSIKEFASCFLQFIFGLTVKFCWFCLSFFIVKLYPWM